MNFLHNFYNHIQIFNYNLFSFSYFLRGKSELPLLNNKVKVLNSCVKNNVDLKTVDQKYLDIGDSSYSIISGRIIIL